MLAMAGCGDKKKSPTVDELPLAPGLRVGIEREVCPVAPDQCQREVVVEGPAGHSERKLMEAELRTLARRGWRPQAAADSGFIGRVAPDVGAEVFLATQTRWLESERRSLPQSLRYSDTRDVPRHVLGNVRRGRQALVATLELPLGK
jgi:hypothetical protein